MTDTKFFLVFGIATLATLAGLMWHRQHIVPSSSSFADFDLYKLGDLSNFGNPEKLALRVVEFKEWARKFEKQYGAEESILRFQTWNDNYDFIEAENAKNLSYKLGINQFSDLSVEEFSALHLGFLGDQSGEVELPSADWVEEPTEEDNEYGVKPRSSSRDWTKSGSVSAVSDQGSCGSCYAWAAAGALEGLYKKQSGKLEVFSPQQIVDCSRNYGNQGCSGGLMTNTYPYTKAKGIIRAQDYPYRNREQTCQDSRFKPVFKNSGFKNVPRDSTNTPLLDAVDQGPVSIGIVASTRTFQNYRSGVFDDKSCASQRLDHAVLVTGYTKMGDRPIWQIKNSWGTSWGDKGYMHAVRALGTGVCGMNTMASYPV